MTGSEAAPTGLRHTRSALLALPLIVRVATLGIRVGRSLASSSPRTASLVGILRGDPPGRPDQTDGVVLDRVTVFDDRTPAVANLDPDLLAALRRAAADAAREGIAFLVSSGWRSRRYQERLLERAVSRCGSVEEAARWVASPDASAHVSGDAVDVGPPDAVAWLSEHGAGYGLCQIYRNEPWHYELRPGAVEAGCPPMYDDPTHDPRMRRATGTGGVSCPGPVERRPPMPRMIPDAVGER